MEAGVQLSVRRFFSSGDTDCRDYGVGQALFEETRRGKKQLLLECSCDKNEGAYRRGEGGEEPGSELRLGRDDEKLYVRRDIIV